MDCSAQLRCTCLVLTALALCWARQSDAVNSTTPAQMDAILSGAVMSAVSRTRCAVLHRQACSPALVGRCQDPLSACHVWPCAQTVPTQLPVYEADLNRPGEAGMPADAVVLFTMNSTEL